MIEDLLNEIPLTIIKYIEDTCYSCGCKHNKRCEYSLKIKVSQHELKTGVVTKRYKIFYETSSFSSGNKDKYIGNPCGFGFLTLEDAFNNLKTYIDREI